MKKAFGLGIAALALALAPASARAQNAVDALAAPPPPEDAIGPAQLRDFTLNGTVTRRAEPQQTPPQPRRQAPAASDATTAARVTAAPESPRAAPPARPQRTADVARPPPPLPSTSLASPEPTPAFAQPVDPLSAPTLPSAPVGDGFSFLPWLLAALAAAGAAAFYFWRQRSQPAYAGAGTAFQAQPEIAPAPVPSPAPRLRPAQPDSAPRLSPSGGIISSRIRPWLEIEFTPARCIYSDNGAVIEFEASLLNSGAAPARDVLLEARLFNAGQAQDEEVTAFFAHPHGQGNRIPEIAPLKRVSVKSAVSLTREQLRAYRLEERLLWVPTIGFTALYRWSGGQGQTSASFILGRETKGEKMAAFRLDQGARVFRGIGARPHTVAVRK